jgi:hypothetical protein
MRSLEFCRPAYQRPLVGSGGAILANPFPLLYQRRSVGSDRSPRVPRVDTVTRNLGHSNPFDLSGVANGLAQSRRHVADPAVQKERAARSSPSRLGRRSRGNRRDTRCPASISAVSTRTFTRPWVTSSGLQTSEFGELSIFAIALSLGNATVVTMDTDLAAVPGLTVENWADAL